MSSVSEFMMGTTPQLLGYKVKKALGLASGLAARTHVVEGKFAQGFSP